METILALWGLSIGGSAGLSYSGTFVVIEISHRLVLFLHNDGGKSFEVDPLITTPHSHDELVG